MISNEAGQQLHDRATRGEPLSEEERAILDVWYARQDAEEAEQLTAGRLAHETSLREQMKNILTRMALLTQKMQETIAENKQLNEELAALYEQSLEAEIVDIPQTYPLMDTTAHRVGTIVVKLDTRRITDWNTFHDVFQEVFGFPDFYGRNMNAWIDCMTSLDAPGDGMTSIPARRGDVIVLQLEHIDDLYRRCPEQYAAIIECSAFVNWRRIDVGEPAVLALSFYKNT